MSEEALLLSSRLMGLVDLGPLHPLSITAFTNEANTSQWDPQHTFTAYTNLIESKVVIIKDRGVFWRRKKKTINCNQPPFSLSFRPNQLLSLSSPWTPVLSIVQLQRSRRLRCLYPITATSPECGLMESKRRWRVWTERFTAV